MLIGLSGRARSGKDTIGDYLAAKHGFLKLYFASALKDIIGRQLFDLSHEQLYGDLKEVVDSRWGLSPRQILQQAGTDKLRKMHDNIWVMPVERNIRNIVSSGETNIVIADCRFPNEIEMIQNIGEELGVETHIIRLERPDFSIGDSSHISETVLDNAGIKWDAIISAPTGVETLIKEFERWFSSVRK